MKKSATLLVLFLIPALASALAVQSCTSGESTGSGSGGTTGTGGKTGGTGGGFTSTGTGGFTSTGTGGFMNTGTGGVGTSGTGGSVGSGGTSLGTGGSAVGTGGSTVTGMDNASALNGYVNNGAWKGYAFTGTFGATATINPVCDAAGTTPCFKTAAKQLCVSGSVGADPTGGTGAFLGWNINQAGMPPNPVTPLATSGIGLSVTLSAAVKGGRVQIQDAAGMKWCYQATPPGDLPPMTTIPWGMFNTTCYNTAMGAFYLPATPITAVQILVPSAAVLVPFNFCLLDAHQY